MSVGVLDYGIGNIGSILSMHRRLAIPAEPVTSADQLDRHDRFILPGVGAFDTGMARLRERGFAGPLERLVIGERRPILGICLGMQMLADRSEEGEGAEKGLGWIPGTVRHMRGRVPPQTRIPFMGWAWITVRRSEPLLEAVGPQRFYFVHSLAFVPDNPDHVIATVDYGAEICAAVGRANVWGTQFHPEKSHRFGMRLLQNFAQMEHEREV